MLVHSIQLFRTIDIVFKICAPVARCHFFDRAELRCFKRNYIVMIMMIMFYIKKLGQIRWEINKMLTSCESLRLFYMLVTLHTNPFLAEVICFQKQQFRYKFHYQQYFPFPAYYYRNLFSENCSQHNSFLLIICLGEEVNTLRGEIITQPNR